MSLAFVGQNTFVDYLWKDHQGLRKNLVCPLNNPLLCNPISMHQHRNRGFLLIEMDTDHLL